MTYFNLHSTETIPNRIVRFLFLQQGPYTTTRHIACLMSMSHIVYVSLLCSPVGCFNSLGPNTLILVSERINIFTWLSWRQFFRFSVERKCNRDSVLLMGRCGRGGNGWREWKWLIYMIVLTIYMIVFIYNACSIIDQYTVVFWWDVT